jgi:hypothetical protein
MSNTDPKPSPPVRDVPSTPDLNDQILVVVQVILTGPTSQIGRKIQNIEALFTSLLNARLAQPCTVPSPLAQPPKPWHHVRHVHRMTRIIRRGDIRTHNHDKHGDDFIIGDLHDITAAINHRLPAPKFEVID